MIKRACKVCKRIVEKNVCPHCKGETTSNFQGIVVIFSTDSEIAKRLGITEAGKYAIKV